MLKHFTATAILVSDTHPKKLLMGLHQKLGVWLPPGGHIEGNENPTECLIREVLEETGFDVGAYIPKEQLLEKRVTLLHHPDFILEERNMPGKDNVEHAHLDLNYIIHVPEFMPVFPKREYKDMRWMTKEELLVVPTFSNIREFILPKVLK